MAGVFIACDGPGRGGIYNINFLNQKIMHISGGDFSVNSTTINGWLRNFLWSQPAQVIQSYSTSIYGV